MSEGLELGGLSSCTSSAIRSGSPPGVTGMRWPVTSRPVYIAPTEQAATERLGEFNELWSEKYPACRPAVGERLDASIAPFLDYEPEIRRVIYSTNAIESLNARMRRATRARGHFLGRPGRAQVPLPCRAQPRPDRTW